MYKRSIILQNIEGLIIEGLIAEAKGEYNVFEELNKADECNPIFHLLYSTDRIEEKPKILTTYISWKVSIDCVDAQGSNIWHHIIMLKNYKNYVKYTENIDNILKTSAEYKKSLNDFGRIIARTNRALHTQANNEGITPMLLAFQHRDIDSMNVLFGLGDDPNAILPGVDISIFQKAIEDEDWEIMELLLTKPSLKFNFTQLTDLYRQNSAPMLEILDKRIRPHAKKRIEIKLEGEAQLGLPVKKENSNQAINLSNENLLQQKLSPRETIPFRAVVASDQLEKVKSTNNLIRKPLPALPTKEVAKSLPDLPLKEESLMKTVEKPLQPPRDQNSMGSIVNPVKVTKPEVLTSQIAKFTVAAKPEVPASQIAKPISRSRAETLSSPVTPRALPFKPEMSGKSVVTNVLPSKAEVSNKSVVTPVSRSRAETLSSPVTPRALPFKPETSSKPVVTSTLAFKAESSNKSVVTGALPFKPETSSKPVVTSTLAFKAESSNKSVVTGALSPKPETSSKPVVTSTSAFKAESSNKSVVTSALSPKPETSSKPIVTPALRPRAQTSGSSVVPSVLSPTTEKSSTFVEKLGLPLQKGQTNTNVVSNSLVKNKLEQFQAKPQAFSETESYSSKITNKGQSFVSKISKNTPEYRGRS